jgi:hypothetical protein
LPRAACQSLSEWRCGCAGWNCRRLRSQARACSCPRGRFCRRRHHDHEDDGDRRPSRGAEARNRRSRPRRLALKAAVLPSCRCRRPTDSPGRAESAALGPGASVPDVPVSMRLPAAAPARASPTLKSRRRARPGAAKDRDSDRTENHGGQLPLPASATVPTSTLAASRSAARQTPRMYLVISKGRCNERNLSCQVRSGQDRFITRPKSRTMRATRQLMLPPSTVSGNLATLE